MATFWKKDVVWTKAKKKKEPNLEDNAWKYFSQLIRLIDCLRTTGLPNIGRCVTCNDLIQNKGNDAGHYIPRTAIVIKYELKNVHLQCRRCNRFQQGRWGEYYQFMEKFYGKGVTDELMFKNGQVERVFKDWDEIAKKYRETEKYIRKQYSEGKYGSNQREVKETFDKLRKLNNIEAFTGTTDIIP